MQEYEQATKKILDLAAEFKHNKAVCDILYKGAQKIRESKPMIKVASAKKRHTDV